jgi:uncharacterized membrane protein
VLRLILQSIPFLVLSYSAQVLMKRGVNSVGVITWSLLAADPVGVLTSLLFNRFVILAFVMAGMGAVVYLVLLSQYDLTIILPVLSAVALLALPVIGRVFLQETVSPGRILGTIIVALGMIVVARS